MTEGLTRAAVYERVLPVSIERVWENVHDWEHLPFLHSAAFCGIALEESGPWGWRARVSLPPHENPSELRIELRLEGETGRYHTRTLEGAGTGSDTITTLRAQGEDETAVRVEFWIPEPDPERAAQVGSGMVALYTMLWNEDEQMMVERQAFLDRRAGAAADAGKAIDLGDEVTLRASLPATFDTPRGRRRIVERGEGLVALSSTCPHLGGPLDDAPLRDGHVICPWHGYRFSLADGRNPDGRACRLPALVPLDIDEAGHAWIPAT